MSALCPAMPSIQHSVVSSTGHQHFLSQRAVSFFFADRAALYRHRGGESDSSCGALTDLSGDAGTGFARMVSEKNHHPSLASRSRMVRALQIGDVYFTTYQTRRLELLWPSLQLTWDSQGPLTFFCPWVPFLFSPGSAANRRLGY